MLTKQDITCEPLEGFTDGAYRGAYIQIRNLLVEVKLSDGLGYVVDIFNNDTEELITTVPVWNDDLETR